MNEASAASAITIRTAVIPTIPAGLKAPVDLLALLEQLRPLDRAEGALRATDQYHQEYGDDRAEGLFQQVQDEAERLQCCEYERDELVKASTGLLLVLSLLSGQERDWLKRMGCNAEAAVETFRAALKECVS